MPDKDPFTQVHDAIWDILEASSEFTAAVPVGNRIKFSGTNVKDPIKDSVLDSDLPEVRLTMEQLRPHLQRTSSTSTAVTAWSFQISSGDLRFEASLFPLSWIIYKAMSNWDGVFSGLTWNARAFTLPLRPADARIGRLDTDLVRGVRQWISIWSAEVEVFFRTIDMQTI